MGAKKTIIVSEAAVKGVWKTILQESLSAQLEVNRVIKDYLDKNFTRQNVDDVSADGYPTTTPMFGMLSHKNEVVKTMTPQEMLMLLNDKFPNIIKDDKDRNKYLKHIAQSWYYNEIDKNGQLKTNVIG